METLTLDRKYFGRDDDLIAIEVTRSEGSIIYDADGREYIDFLMGWCVGNFGWGNEEINTAIKNADTPTYVPPHMLYRPWAELAELLASIAPGNLTKSYRTTGGSEAVDAAMQIAMCYTGRNKFLSVEGSYHGNSIAALSIGSSENRKTYKNLLRNCFKIEPPLDKKALKNIKARLKKKDVAAFIMEPVICNLGVLIPTQEFMTGVQELCDKYGTLLVIDEVATGFGRTGKLFASEHFNISPDIICVSKGMSGGYAGIGATITTDAIAQAIHQDFSLYSTYAWHPVSVEATLASINYLLRNRDALFRNVTEVENIFRDRLSHMKFSNKTKLHIIGLAIGIDLGDPGYAGEIKEKCQEKGLLIASAGSCITMFPALNVEQDIVHNGLDIFEECI